VQAGFFRWKSRFYAVL